MLSSDRREGRRIFLATPGFESALTTELRTGAHVGGVVWGGFMPEQPPGIVNAPEPGPQEVRLDAVFARQQLPNAVGNGAPPSPPSRNPPTVGSRGPWIG